MNKKTRILSIVNQKGGVAKTTTSTNLAIGLCKKGKKVLFIDFDPQGNATTGFGINKMEMKHSVYDLLKKGNFPGFDGVDFDGVVINKHGIDILPNNMKMSKIDIEFAGVMAREQALATVLKYSKRHYDYIIIDCPPSLSIATINALAVSTSIYIPIQADMYALEGLAELTDTVSFIQEKLNPHLKIKGIFLTIADVRTSLFADVNTEVGKYFKEELIQIPIRRDENLKKAVVDGVSIFDFKISSNGAKDYLALIDEILKREGDSL